MNDTKAIQSIKTHSQKTAYKTFKNSFKTYKQNFDATLEKTDKAFKVYILSSW